MPAEVFRNKEKGYYSSCATLVPNVIIIIYNQMSYTGKYQIIKAAMHKHEYGCCGLNGYILPIYYSCVFTISLIPFLRLTRDLLIMLPRDGQLLIGREAGEIEGHFLLSEKKPQKTKQKQNQTSLKKHCNRPESHKPKMLQKAHSLELHFASLFQDS